MNTRILAALLMVAFVSGCVTPPPKLDPKKPVTFERSILQPSLRQDGLVIDEFDALNHFENIETARQHVDHARIFYWTSIASAGVGGWLVGTYLGQKEKESGNLIGGVALIGLSTLLATMQKASIQDAVDIYNRDLKESRGGNKNGASFKLDPGFAVVPGGAVLGAQATF